MRILVVGTCQAPEVGRCMQVLLPRAEVEFHEWVTLERRARFAALAERLPDFDIVFAQPQGQERYAALSDEVLRDRARRLNFFPIVSFTGLHPDCVYLPGNLAGPMGEYHSALVVAAYRMGIPEHEVPPLFNALVFSALGYFSEASISRTYFLESAARLGYDLADAFDGWMASGAFLHTLNHPKPLVIETLAQQALAKEGVEAGTPPSKMPASHLAQGETWPVYPEIAHRLGFEGDMLFLPRQVGSARRKAMPLEEFVARSYALYASVPQERLADSRILELQTALLRLQRRGYDTVASSDQEVQNRLLVQSFYRAILCRDADEGGLHEYAARLDRGAPGAIEEVVAALARSPEAMALHARQLAQLREDADRSI